MQLFPFNWFGGRDGPCYMIVGNWLDATESEFVTDHNIQLVIKASGTNPKSNYQKPPYYGTNRHTGCQPELHECLVNNRRLVCAKWLPRCEACIRMWKDARRGEPPPSVFVHCNEGINRAPALASLLAAELQGCQPFEASKVLAEAREVNPMFKLGRGHAERMSLTTWSMMHAVDVIWPWQVYYRDAIGVVPRDMPMWVHVPMSERVRTWIPKSTVVLTPGPGHARPSSASTDVAPTGNVNRATKKARPSTAANLARPCPVRDIRGFKPVTQAERDAARTRGLVPGLSSSSDGAPAGVVNPVSAASDDDMSGRHGPTDAKQRKEEARKRRWL